jgi:hypothetical protein
MDIGFLIGKKPMRSSLVDDLSHIGLIEKLKLCFLLLLFFVAASLLCVCFLRFLFVEIFFFYVLIGLNH